MNTSEMCDFSGSITYKSNGILLEGGKIEYLYSDTLVAHRYIKLNRV